MIKVTDMSYSYGFGPVFDSVSFSVGTGFIAGLVGPNGAGKSTLLKLLRGEDTPIAGTITVQGSIGYVPQEVKTDPILDSAATSREYIDPQNKKDDFELLRMLAGIEAADISLTNQPQQLSGGQKTKLAILRALISEPDILLLDEPTNFLDTAGKTWLMDFLGAYSKTILLISHDLPLLDAQIDKVIAINPQNKKIEEYKGNYTSFIKLKAEADALLKRKILNEQKHIKQMEKGLQRMARFTSKKGVRQRTVLKRRIEKLKENLPELPKEIQKITIELPIPPGVGEIPISAKHIVKLYDHELILADISLSLRRGERVALLGPNGVGKSTFIKILMGVLEADEGVVQRDERVKIGYYSQEFETFDFSKTVMETVRDVSDFSEDRLRPFLARFNFPHQRISQRVETLSGGEKTRLAIAVMLLQNPNLLILDEPTTYLDVLSQRIILDALKKFSGAMLFVSHTEEFVEELAPNRVLLLPENRIEYWMPEFVKRVGQQ